MASDATSQHTCGVGHVGQVQRVVLVAFSEQDRAVLTVALETQR